MVNQTKPSRAELAAISSELRNVVDQLSDTVEISDKKEQGDLEFLKKYWHLCTHMRFLIIEFLDLKSIPDFVFEMDNLELLSLDNNKIIGIPDEIEKLQKLEYLSLRDNKLRYLPSTMSNLSNLKRLDVSVNLLQILPHWLEDLNLKELSFEDNSSKLIVPAWAKKFVSKKN